MLKGFLPSFWYSVIPSIVIIALLSSCTTVPETGRLHMVLTSPDQDAAIGAANFQKIKNSKTPSHNAAYNDQVSRVGRKIAAVADVRAAHWEFFVFEDSVPNAFALPGGKVMVSTGMLRLTTSDALLAVVIGHEVGHVAARHGGERTSQTSVADLGAVVLDTALQSQNIGASERSLLLKTYGSGAKLGVLLPYSRLHESEADRIGLMYMARAGYNPEAAVTFWQKFAAANRAQGGGKELAFLSTHPVDEARIVGIQKHLPKALEEYQGARSAAR